MELRYLLKLQDKPGWSRRFNNLNELVKFAKEEKYPFCINVDVLQIKKGEWTAGRLSLFI